MVDTQKRKTGPIWHYTVLDRLQSILNDQEIRPATIGIAPGEKPVVWFSRRQDWEPTATKLVENSLGQSRRATISEMERAGMVRIGVAPDAAPYSWQDFKRLSGCPGRVSKALYQTAIGQGAKPGDWFVSFGPVLADDWLTVEVWAGGAWVPFRDVAEDQPTEG